MKLLPLLAALFCGCAHFPMDKAAIEYATLPAKLAPYRVTNDADLPWAYQTANPQGRPLHDDWFFDKDEPRINTAFKVPLPFKKIAGNAEPEWVPLLKDWPLAPGAITKQEVWHDGGLSPTGKDGQIITLVLTMTPIHPPGQWSRQAVYLNGEWVECYYTKTTTVRTHPDGSIDRMLVYEGLKLDPNPPDLMTWFPEVSASIKWNWRAGQ